MPISRLEYLFSCYINNNYNEQEEEELMELLSHPENKTAVQILIDKVIENTGSEIQMHDDTAASVLQNILNKDRGLVLPVEPKKTPFTRWMRIAAVLFCIAVTTYFVFINKDSGKKSVTVAHNDLPAQPGGNRALLTLSDGSTILLDSTQTKTFRQGTININKQGDVLIYGASAHSNLSDIRVYNDLSTPRGGQYQVVLTDGSKVWLNAASSLHFPVAFTGSRQREVELTGEGYFEVAKDVKKPFRVKVGELWIDVLGTHFNISAYTDDAAIKTSLLEGSVKITKGSISDWLKPDQQAILNKKEDKVKIVNANMNEVIAWKNGWFQFDGADITAIMRQISRWYNVQIVYAGKVPLRRFEGKISRQAQLSEVLQILELSEVKFSVEGRKIIVQ